MKRVFIITLFTAAAASAQNVSPPQDRTVMNVAGDVLTDPGRIAVDAVQANDEPALTFAAIGEPILIVDGRKIGEVAGVATDREGRLRTLMVNLDDSLPGNLDRIALSARGAARTQDGLVLTLGRAEVYQLIEANAS